MSRAITEDEPPLALDLGAAPHLAGGDSFAQITRTMLAVAGMVGVTGMALFGLTAAVWLVIAVVAAVVGEWVYVRLTSRRVTATFGHAALMGLLVGLTLPVGRFEAGQFHPLGWVVPLSAGLIAIVVGKGLMGGMGNYLWHPALVGRAAVELLYPERVHPTLWTVLGRDKLFSAVPNPVELVEYAGWRISELPEAANAWALRAPADWLRRCAEGGLGGGEHPLTVLVRDVLPPFEDALLGGVGGGIGETCAVVLIVGGLYLIYRGYVRWFQPVSVILAAAVAAAILPIRTGPEASFEWLPGLETDGSLPVGVIYVLHHLTSGGLMLGAFLIATDMVSSPRTGRGQVIFCAGIGVLTIVLRLYGPIPGSCYWAILIMNTLGGLIDRSTRRLLMGT